MNDDTALLTTEQVIAYWESRIEKNPFLEQYLGTQFWRSSLSYICPRCGWSTSWTVARGSTHRGAADAGGADFAHNCNHRAACIAACDAGLTELSVPDVNNLPIWLMGVAKIIPETSIGGESIHLVWVPRWWLNATKRLVGSIGNANAPDRKEALNTLTDLANAYRSGDQETLDRILGLLELSDKDPCVDP